MPTVSSAEVQTHRALSPVQTIKSTSPAHSFFSQSKVTSMSDMGESHSLSVSTDNHPHIRNCRPPLPRDAASTTVVIAIVVAFEA